VECTLPANETKHFNKFGSMAIEMEEGIIKTGDFL
jgi:hypothetical protein